jgi:NADH-quinone oxidoreductase subunit N
LRGLLYRRPAIAATLTIALISLTGFPLTVGFVGKFAIFKAGLEAQLWQLIFHYVLASLFALFVIARLILIMWQPTTGPAPSSTKIFASTSPWPVIVGIALILGLGIYPEPWISWVIGLA